MSKKTDQNESEDDIGEAFALYKSNVSYESIRGLDRLIQYCWEGRAEEVARTKGVLDAAFCFALSKKADEEYCGASLLHVLSVCGANDVLNERDDFPRIHEKLLASENEAVRSFAAEIQGPLRTNQQNKAKPCCSCP